MNLNNIKRPIFIPALQDSSIDSLGTKYPAILADTTHITWRVLTFRKLKKKTDLFIVNPSTDCLMYKNAKSKSNFRKLKYDSEIEPEKLYSDANFRIEKIVAPAIEDQIKKNADIIIAPYFFFEDTDSTKFSLNLSLIADSVHYMKDHGIDKPLFAMIKTDKSILTRSIIRDNIVSRYKEDFTNKLSGFFIAINDFDSKRDDLDTLLGFATLVSSLSRDSIVIPFKINDFGFVLSVIGAAGFSSGIMGGESFSVKALQERPHGWKNKNVPKTYVPELFDYVNDNFLKKIGYKCSCVICNGTLPQGASAKKKHFFISKMQISNSLSKLDKEGKYIFLKNKLKEAVKYGSDLSRKYNEDIKTLHLSRWEKVLEIAHSLKEEDSESENKLNLLLEELDSHD